MPALANAMISYNMGSVSPRPVDTVATYICDTDFDLTGTSTRTCSGGVWDASEPTCTGTYDYYTILTVPQTDLL